jgi:hypothetical protein
MTTETSAMTTETPASTSPAATPTDSRPWEPPTAGSETEHLLGALDRMRWTFRWKTGHLDRAGLQTRVGSSALTLGGLLKHLAFVEDFTFTTKLRGESPGEPWESTYRFDVEDWVFVSAADQPPEELYALWDEAVERSRARVAAVLADGGLDQPVDLADEEGRQVSLRRLLFDLLEEYGRHVGHADLLREAVDGVVGEDPPDGWRP